MMIIPEALPDEVTEVTGTLSGNRKTLSTIVSTSHDHDVSG
jgi:hypothetical protein